MNCWSEEKKLGTDELLMTLPVTDFDIILGKFFSLVSIFITSLVFSLTLVLAISFLGSPDPGVIFGNYVAYLMLGTAMISVGMVASMLTSNATVAFILGVLFNSIFLFSGFASAFADSFMFADAAFQLLKTVGFNEKSGMIANFNEISTGAFSLPSIVYFFSITAIMLYLNLIVLGKRHWQTGKEHILKMHYCLRIVSLFICLVALNVILEKSTFRIDTTSEKIHSFSPESKALMSTVEKPVLIQVFVSKKMSSEYIETKNKLMIKLKTIARLSGGIVKIHIQEIEARTKIADEIRDKYNIRPIKVREMRHGQVSLREIFMGLVISSGSHEQIIPFLAKGLPVEYELVRTIRVVAGAKRKKIGILKTDAEIQGGFSMQTGSKPKWMVVDELEKQYEIVNVSADSAIQGDFDALLAVMPSSLNQKQMVNLQNYILNGGHTMLVFDPLPLFNPAASPKLPKAKKQQSPFSRGGPPPEPKGNFTALLESIGVRFDPNKIAFSAYNPHPAFNFPPEFIVIGADNPNSFNPDSDITSGLQEVLTLFPGALMETGKKSWVKFTPLLKTGGAENGFSDWNEHLSRGYPPFSPAWQVKEWTAYKKRFLEDERLNIAAQITGSRTIKKNGKDSKIELNTILISDIDMISNTFFGLRSNGVKELNFDNVNFVLNAIDSLSGDKTFIEIRKKRTKHRVLTRFDKKREELNKIKTKQLKEAELKATTELNLAEKRLREKVEKIKNDKNLKEDEKNMRAAIVQNLEQRRFEVRKTEVEREKEQNIKNAENKMDEAIRNEKKNFVNLTILLPPILPFILGIIVFFRRRKKEMLGVAQSRIKGVS